MGLLDGKTAIVTGAARGIGKAIALKFAAEGANIAFTDLVIDVNAEKTRVELEAMGVKAKGYASNAANFEDTAKVVEEIHKDFGRIDILVNNAGITRDGLMMRMSEQQWDMVINVNLNGEYYMASEFARYLKANNKKGSIVNTASMSGHIVNWPQEQASYNASKAAVMQMTKSLAVEYCHDDIRVNSISPGYMRTELCVFVDQDWQKRWMDLTPYGRYGEPSELCGAVIYLLSESASFTSGADIVIDGCYTCV